MYHNKKYRDIRANCGIIGMIVAAALIVIYSTQLFTSQAKKAADETTVALSKFYLEEIAERTVYEINTAIENSKAQLERASKRLSQEKPQSKKELRSFLATVQELNGLDIFAAVGKDGMVYTSENSFYGLTRFGFLSEPITEIRILMTRTGHSNAMLLIAMPIEDFAFGSDKIVSCITGIDIDKIISSHQIQGINNQVLCRLFDGTDGTCIVEQDDRYTDGSSIFDVWSNDCTFSEEYPLEKLISDWKNGTEGYSNYISSEGATYLYYKPVPDTTWMVSTRLRGSVISEQITLANQHILNASTRNMIVIILVMIVVLLFTTRQVSQIRAVQYAKEKEEVLLRQEAEASERQLKLQEQLLQEEKEAGRQASVLQVLSKKYTSVFYIDKQKNETLPIRLSEYSVQRYGLKVNCPTSLDDFLKKYSMDCLEPEQRLEIQKLSDPAYLEQLLSNNENYTFLYRVKHQGEAVYAQIRLSSTEDHHIVMGIAIVDKEVREEQEQQRLLKEALTQAEAANRAKTAFLNNMSHDIRTPINGIVGMLSILKKSENNPERVHDCIHNIDTSSHLLLSLINDVLDMAKLESNAVIMNNESVELDQICGEITSAVVFQAEEAGLQVTQDHDDYHGVYVLCSPLHLKKVLMNLFTNSTKYNKPNGSIHTSMKTLERTEDTITIEFKISDTGIGMSEDFIKNKLFTPFVQANNSPRTSYMGTGLGMSIVKAIIEKMNGSIKVESVLGEGSCFTVVLPFKIDHCELKDSRKDFSSADITGLHLLLVEDNELNAEIAQFMLTDNGAKVVIASNGAEALQIFETAEPRTYDAILMDIMMPVMDGYTATRKIRALEREDAKEVPIIAMTANVFQEDIDKCLEAGMNAHLAKPLEIEKLKRTVYEQISIRN